MVQLGALKNADKVNEVVSKLRSAGYRVYTSPSTPVQGKITRILVGPEASKDKLKGSLGELKQISGLSGVVMGYTRELTAEEKKRRHFSSLSVRQSGQG